MDSEVNCSTSSRLRSRVEKSRAVEQQLKLEGIDGRVPALCTGGFVGDERGVTLCIGGQRSKCDDSFNFA